MPWSSHALNIQAKGVGRGGGIRGREVRRRGGAGRVGTSGGAGAITLALPALARGLVRHGSGSCSGSSASLVLVRKRSHFELVVLVLVVHALLIKMFKLLHRETAIPLQLGFPNVDSLRELHQRAVVQFQTL